MFKVPDWDGLDFSGVTTSMISLITPHDKKIKPFRKGQVSVIELGEANFDHPLQQSGDKLGDNLLGPEARKF